MATTVRLTGQYCFELFWDCDNTTNEASVTREFRFKKTERLTKTTLQERIESIDTSLKFSKESGASAQIELVNVTDKTEFSLAGTVFKKSFWREGVDTELYTESEETNTFTVGPRSAVRFYRLKFSAPGVECEFGLGAVIQRAPNAPLPALDDVLIDIAVRPPLYTWIRVHRGQKLPSNVFTMDTRYPLCRAQYSDIRPGFVNNGRAEVCYRDKRHVVDQYEVLVLHPHARVSYVHNSLPYVDQDHIPPNCLLVGQNGHPVCRAYHGSDPADAPRPAFVNGRHAEVAWGNDRHLHSGWEWVCIS